jgi:hypothetical protein
MLMESILKNYCGLFITLLVLGVGLNACGETKSAATPKAKATPIATSNPKPKSTAKAPASPPNKSFQQALDRADSARSIAQSAANTDDWKLAASRWEDAIEYVKAVPKKDVNHKAAAGKLAEYQRGLEIAQAKSQGQKVQGRLVADIGADRPIDPDVQMNTAQSRTFRVPIKYHSAKIPVVDVTFNNGQVFEMLVDTGASGTMISYDAANALGVREAGKVNVGTAAGNATVSVALIKSIGVGGKSIYNVPVTVGPVGLLGHDFFGDCVVTLRRDVVEFGECST